MKNRKLVMFLIASILTLPSEASATWYRFRAMTFNIHGGANAANVYQVGATGAAIRNSGADVVALQEVNRWWDVPCHDSFQDLRVELSAVYPYSIFAASDSQPANLFFCGWSRPRSTGNAIFSKYPIQSTWSLSLPTSWTKRVAVAVSVSKNNVPFTIYATHLQNDPKGVPRAGAQDRRAQAQAIANDARPRLNSSNVFVLADFNAGAGSWELAPLGSIMVPPSNSWGVNFGYTYPWSSNQTTDCSVTSSDHCPVVLDWWYWR